MVTVYIAAAVLLVLVLAAAVLIGMQRQTVIQLRNDLRERAGELAAAEVDAEDAEQRVAVLEYREQQVREFLTSALVGFNEGVIRELDLWLWAQTLTEAEQAAQTTEDEA